MPKKILVFIILFLFVVSTAVIAIDKPIYTPVKKAGELSKYVGQKVSVDGKISTIMWQHIMGFYKTHPWHNYFDFDKTQIVVYSKKKITEKGKIRVSGTVVELKGGGAPKGKKTKVDESYKEYHILADIINKM